MAHREAMESQSSPRGGQDHAWLSGQPKSSQSGRPGLARTDSARARDMALARLMGAGPADHTDDPLSPSFRTAGPPPTLEELQRRHADSRPITPGSPASPSTSIPSQRRQEARTNLIRKLSRSREQGGARGPTAKQKEQDVPIPLQPFEIDAVAPDLHRTDSSASTSSRAQVSTAPTSVASQDSSPTHQRGGSKGPGRPDEASPTNTSVSAASSPRVTAKVPFFAAQDDLTVSEILDTRASMAPSMYRPYRHTMERDRDSAFARLTAEDVWEFDSSSGPETDSPRFPISPHLQATPPMPPTKPALLAAAERDRQGSHQSSLSNATVQADERTGDGLGFVLSANGHEPAGELTSREIPEAGYRFPGPTPAHSLEHAALRGQSRANESPASTVSFRSAANEPSATPSSTHYSQADSPNERTPSRRPRSSSLSVHSSGRRPSEGAEILSSLPARRSSKPQTHRRGESSRSMNRHDSPESEEWEEAARKRVALTNAAQSSSTERILSRLGTILQAAEQNGSTDYSLDDPPRQLLLDAPVLQVVNANTVKDRYLFLFSDVLLIAKPIVDEQGSGDIIIPSLDTRFLVKSVVEIGQLKMTAQRDDDDDVDPVQRRKHPQLLAFIDRFANDPYRAIQTLVQRGGIANDAHVIASLLFKTTELSRSQLGAYLSARDARPVLKAYVERFRLHGIRIEDAIRSFLSSLRLPKDLATAEHLLNVFANVWLVCNPSPSQDPAFAKKLVVAILELNDFLNSSSNGVGEGALGNLFGFANPAVSVEDFTAAFRSKDPSFACSDETLTRIYMSIKKERLQQAANNDNPLPERPVTFTPARMPHRLTLRRPTQLLTVSIAQPDPSFTIRLVGQDLRVEPSALSFAQSRTQTFRVTGTALGHKTLLFLKLGPNAMRYSNVPINQSFSVERAFMRHTFQLAFVNHLNIKRKYMFSMQEATSRTEWVNQLQDSIDDARRVSSTPSPRATHAAKAVALQVLRDALIAAEDGAFINGTPLSRSKPASRPGSAKTEQTSIGRLGHQRSNSVSKTYAAGAGRDEVELAQLSHPMDTPAGSRIGKPRMPLHSSPSFAYAHRRGSRDDSGAAEGSLEHIYTGHELVMFARQNSLLPSVLGLMNSLREPTHLPIH